MVSKMAVPTGPSVSSSGVSGACVVVVCAGGSAADSAPVHWYGFSSDDVEASSFSSPEARTTTTRARAVVSRVVRASDLLIRYVSRRPAVVRTLLRVAPWLFIEDSMVEASSELWLEREEGGGARREEGHGKGIIASKKKTPNVKRKPNPQLPYIHGDDAQQNVNKVTTPAT